MSSRRNATGTAFRIQKRRNRRCPYARVVESMARPGPYSTAPVGATATIFLLRRKPEKLGKNHPGQEQSTTCKCPERKNLAENEPSPEGGKAAFKTLK